MNRNNNNSMADRRNRNAARLDRGWRYFRCRANGTAQIAENTYGALEPFGRHHPQTRTP